MKKTRIILMSPRGKRFTQREAQRLAGYDRLIFLCGRYEGIDERVSDHLIDEELSIGDYVLTGGEVAAVVITDAVVRLLPGVLGDPESAAGDSFTRGLLDHPHYTRPEVLDGLAVPEALTSGNHEVIRRWRLKQSLGRTWQRRPELINNLALTDEQESLLAEYVREVRDSVK
jgi:tRNA (guanine37-N1)-methyltransferase